MKTREVTHRELAQLLDELDIRAAAPQHAPAAAETRSNRRRSDRRPFRTWCTVMYWDHHTRGPAELRGRTRNLSRLGLSVLSPRELIFGEPIEVGFSLAGSEPLYMTGLVRFCRYAGRGYYEVGVAMRYAGDDAILHLPKEARDETYPWLREAIARQ